MVQTPPFRVTPDIPHLTNQKKDLFNLGLYGMIFFKTWFILQMNQLVRASHFCTFMHHHFLREKKTLAN